MSHEIDYLFEDHGSIFMVTPQTPEAREHLEMNIDNKAMWFGLSLVVEPRYVRDLAEGLDAEGYSWTLETVVS